MILKEDVDFIKECFDALYRRREPNGNYLPAKKPPYHAQDGGVPPEMFAGEITESGWVRWRLLESDLNENDVIAVENKYDVTFPPLFRAYLIAMFHLFEQIGNGQFSISLPPIPCDNPFGTLNELLGFVMPLSEKRYTPFGDYEDWGVLCFDNEQKLPNGDCAVVWFDHELLGRSVDVNKANPLFTSFRELMREMFLDNK